MVTLADVARLSGTSRSTASRALKNDRRITPATTERVRKIADQLDYHPNLAARSLSTGRSGILGLVVPSAHLTGDPYGARVVSAVASSASASEQALMLWLSHERPGRAIQEVLRNGLVDGLVISIVAQDDPWVETLLDSDLPCVLFGRHALRDDVSYATIDNVGGTRALLAHLEEMSYSRLATIRGPRGNADADERYDVWVEHVGGPDLVDANLVATGDWTYASGYTAAKALLGRRPDCIVAANDQMAIGAYDAIVESGLSVPEDVGLTGFDDILEHHRADLGLTTVHQDVQRVGAEAVSVLLELIDGAPGPLQRTLPTSLVVRASTQRSRASRPVPFDGRRPMT